MVAALAHRTASPGLSAVSGRETPTPAPLWGVSELQALRGFPRELLLSPLSQSTGGT